MVHPRNRLRGDGPVRRNLSMNLGRRMIQPLLLLLLLLLLACTGVAASSSSSTISTTHTIHNDTINRQLQFALDVGGIRNSETTAVPEFQVPPDFYTDKCDPCVARTDYTIQVVVHGSSSDVYWQQVQSAMQQASRDTHVRLTMELQPPGLTADEISLRMATAVRRSSLSDDRPDALIVSLPSPRVLQAVQLALERGMPVFGFQTGYQAVQEVPLLGFVAQDEEYAGQRVAELIMERMNIVDGGGDIDIDDESILVDGNTTALDAEEENDGPSFLEQQANIKRVLFVNHDSDAIEDIQVQAARYKGFRATLIDQQLDNSTEIQVTQIFVDLNDVFSAARSFENLAFLNCKYNYVVLGAPDHIDIALSALQNSGCQDDLDSSMGAARARGTQLAAFGMGPGVVEGIVTGRLAFTAAPQHYMESVFAVVMASMFVTTGKKLALPNTGSNIYLSGPVMITQDNIPSDSQQRCLEQAFPVCDPTGNPWDLTPTTTNSETADLCNTKGCLARDVIRIGGVLHGVSSDLFWDPVFAAARQAAGDIGVVLDLERMDAQETTEIVHAKMAARIQNLCESGVDGLFVTIPADVVRTRQTNTLVFILL